MIIMCNNINNIILIIILIMCNNMCNIMCINENNIINNEND